jgi:hypothetical protein
MLNLFLGIIRGKWLRMHCPYHPFRLVCRLVVSPVAAATRLAIAANRVVGNLIHLINLNIDCNRVVALGRATGALAFVPVTHNSNGARRTGQEYAAELEGIYVSFT